jgi:hypothetical protein
MIYSFPTNVTLWAKYAEIRAESLHVHGDQRETTAFYEASRELMDSGA